MVKLTRIYTRGGDKGKTGLVDGSRVAKNSPRIIAIGDVDEANAAIGLACCSASGNAANVLERIQNDLFDLGADIATPLLESEGQGDALRITSSQVSWLEGQTDDLIAEQADLDSFVLPGGNELAAITHLARAITRRAERAVVALAEQEPINPVSIHYLNRLSDLLFALARHFNGDGEGDVKWRPGAGRKP